MIKKILSGILALSMFPFVSAMAEKESFYEESYESFVTNDLPGEYEFYAENVHVAERVPGVEKSVEMTSSDGEVVIERAFETTEDDLNIKFD